MNETIRHLIETTLGWMMDINNRVGDTMGWTITSIHREFIDFLEDLDEDTTFEAYSTMCKRLMTHHAMARNDIYDGETFLVRICPNGNLLSEDEWSTVSREEKDVRSLLRIWHRDLNA